jgi:hypothetical protein
LAQFATIQREQQGGWSALEVDVDPIEVIGPLLHGLQVSDATPAVVLAFDADLMDALRRLGPGGRAIVPLPYVASDTARALNFERDRALSGPQVILLGNGSQLRALFQGLPDVSSLIGGQVWEMAAATARPTEFTLRLDADVVDLAARHAQRIGTSLDRIVENLLRAMVHSPEVDPRPTPLSDSLVGRAGDAHIDDRDDEEAYQRHLEDKYR